MGSNGLSRLPVLDLVPYGKGLQTVAHEPCWAREQVLTGPPKGSK